jgi:TolB-like protein/Flp pilus assembly protein TadD
VLTTQKDPKTNSVQPSIIRGQLEKILAHRLFVRSERMARFLGFTVEQSLQGKGADLKEYLIGIEVFDRNENYDPRIDPIVRVEARRLRGKLQAYYEGDGQNDPVLIEFASGTYAPRIRYRNEIPEIIPPALRSVAVLPFTNLSRRAEDDYFSDGLTEELIHTLTKFSGMRVMAWNSAVRMRGTEQDLPALRRQLQVSHIMTGSVRISEAGLRVRAQLIDTETGAYLWSETFDRPMQEVFAIQEEIARAIVRTLRVQLAGGAERVILTRSDTSLSSYDYYLKGRYHWHRRTPDDLTRSARYFEAAIEADPHSALAYSGLADAYTLLVDYGVVHPVEGIPQAKAAAMRAIQLDNNLANAYPALALIRSHCDGARDEAELLYRKAIALNPGCATAHHRLGIVYFALLGRFVEAIEALETAIRLDPLSSILYEGRAVLNLLQRRYEAALQGYRAVLEFDPRYYRAYTGMGRTYALMGRFGEALAMLEKARALGGDLPYILSGLGQVYALAGDHASSRSILANLHARAREGYIPSTCFAIIHLGLGERDQTLDWLEKGCEQREMRLAILKVHPVYDELRGHPRFQAILKRLGLE